jgi:tRNA modification GTPase
VPPFGGCPIWLIRNKVDLGTAAWPVPQGFDRVLEVSALTGSGFTPLTAALTEAVASDLGSGESALVGDERQAHALRQASEAIRRAWAASEPEIVAEELRRATDALGRVTGRVDVEDVLGAIFARFCVGK